MSDLNLNKSSNKLLTYILSTLVVVLFGSTVFLVERWFDTMGTATDKMTDSINNLNIEIRELKTTIDFINKDVQKLKERH